MEQHSTRASSTVKGALYCNLDVVGSSHMKNRNKKYTSSTRVVIISYGYLYVWHLQLFGYYRSFQNKNTNLQGFSPALEAKTMALEESLSQ